jgi:uncharacterized membrane protein
MNERRIHQIFQVSVILKGAHALIESVGGIALYFISTDTILGLVKQITQDELLDDPNDFLATRLLHMAQDFSVADKSFYAFYLLGHDRMWSYPASLVVMTAFIVYQLYRFSYTHSFGLIVLTVFDIFVIVLIWHEWRLIRSLRSRRI